MKNLVEEKKKHYVIVHVSGNDINRFISRCQSAKINIHKIKYVDGNNVNIVILNSDLKKLKRQNISYTFKVIDNLGVYNAKNIIIRNKFFLTAVIFGLGLLYFLSNIIVSVEVIHSNREIRELVASELENFGIKRLSFKKNYKELEVIKKKLVDKYPDKIEWLEINIIGMNYRISVEERILTEIDDQKKACHIVSTKDAIVTKIINHQGLTVVDTNKYVKNGDILISGNILVDEEIKGTVCAVGDVYGEVWYEVSVSVPLNYEQSSLTGKNRYNFFYETSKRKNKVFKSRLENSLDKNKKIFSIFETTLYFQIESEIKLIPRIYNDEEALTQALELAKDKINVKLSDNEKILSQKVLKKSSNDSTMIVGIFVSVEELISNSIEFTNEELGSNDQSNTS